MNVGRNLVGKRDVKYCKRLWRNGRMGKYEAPSVRSEPLLKVRPTTNRMNSFPFRYTLEYVAWRMPRDSFEIEQINAEQWGNQIFDCIAERSESYSVRYFTARYKILKQEKISGCSRQRRWKYRVYQNVCSYFDEEFNSSFLARQTAKHPSVVYSQSVAQTVFGFEQRIVALILYISKMASFI